jgi:REP element-mobilizing transposase RayT
MPIKYDPEIHHRRSIRYKGYDYSRAGYYYVTICCQDKICHFGKIENKQMILSEIGNIVNEEWQNLKNRYNNVDLDVYQIMPNHFHGIVIIKEMYYVGMGLVPIQNNENQSEGMGLVPIQNNENQSVGMGLVPIQNNENQSVGMGLVPIQNNENQGKRIGTSPIPTIGNIIGSFKSLVAVRSLKLYKSKNQYLPKIWQENYWEHIIRSSKEHYNIGTYILNKVEYWHDDELYVDM